MATKETPNNTTTTEPPPAKRARGPTTPTATTATTTPLPEAFTNDRTLASFQTTSLLRFDGGGKYVVLQGTLPDSNNVPQPALLQLEQRAACDAADTLIANLPHFQLTPTNHSGAEYSFYQAVGLGATFNMEVIWPASARQIQRKTPSPQVLVEETMELYHDLVQQFATEQSLRIGWLDAVVNLTKELERNLFHNDRFVINVDTKWTTHAEPLSVDPTIRQSWHEAKWTDGLYLLAIAKDPALKTIRDLTGEQGAALCEDMRDQLRHAAMSVYGVPASQLRIMFHYHPQFYRLHAHCVRVHSLNPGSEVERAHLLTTVANNLRMKEDYYQQCTLSYKVRLGERLHRLLDAAGRGVVK